MEGLLHVLVSINEILGGYNITVHLSLQTDKITDTPRLIIEIICAPDETIRDIVSKETLSRLATDESTAKLVRCWSYDDANPRRLVIECDPSSILSCEFFIPISVLHQLLHDSRYKKTDGGITTDQPIITWYKDVFPGLRFWTLKITVSHDGSDLASVIPNNTLPIEIDDTEWLKTTAQQCRYHIANRLLIEENISAGCTSFELQSSIRGRVMTNGDPMSSLRPHFGTITSCCRRLAAIDAERFHRYGVDLAWSNWSWMPSIGHECITHAEDFLTDH